MNTTELENNPYSDAPDVSDGSDVSDEFVETPNPVNVPALLAFIVSLAGFLFVTSKFFFFIPVLAIVLAVVSIGVFIASPRPMVGRWLCVIALGLSLFFIVWRISYERMRAAEVSNAAIPIGIEWLGYLKDGETLKAHVLTVEFSKRSSSQTEMIYDYRDPNLEKGLDPERLEDAQKNSSWAKHRQFVEGELVQRLLKYRDSLDYKFVELVGYTRMDNRLDEVAALYEIAYTDETGKQQSEMVRLLLTREDRGEYFNAHWYINGISESLREDEAKQKSKRRKVRR